MTRATDNALDALHAMTADGLTSEIKRLKEAGEGIPPSLLAAASKFLKDNGVDRPIRPGDPTDLLSQEMPEFDADGNVVLITGEANVHSG